MSARIRTRLATVVVATLIATGAALLPGSPALAACSGASCTGRDPQANGCSSSAYTIDEFTSHGARFEMRYSPVCGAAWTRTTSSTHFNALWGQIRTTGNTVYGAQVIDGQNWTRMINFQNLVKTCVAPSPTGGTWACTALH